MIATPDQSARIATRSARTAGAYARLPRARRRGGHARPDHRPDLTDTVAGRRHRPVSAVGRSGARSSRSIPGAIWSARCSPTSIARGLSTSGRPSRSPRRDINMPEIRDAIAAGRARAGRRRSLRDERRRARHEGRDRAGLVSARHRRALRRRRGATCGARCSSRPAACFPELVTRPDLHVFLPPIGGITLYSSAIRRKLGRSPDAARLPRARRVQRLRRVRLRHLHLPALSRARRSRSASQMAQAGRRRARRLQPQGRPRARRGDQVPRLQRAQAAAGRRPRRRPISSAPNASPACRTCASRS